MVASMQVTLPNTKLIKKTTKNTKLNY